ncbi:uncharacterized protein LOC144705559 isoform X1 [Wolffia australiana]
MNSLLLAIAIALLLPLIPSMADQNDTIVDVLRSNDLPIGLFPLQFKQFQIDSQGKFLLTLDRPCDARFDDELHYDVEITGTIGYGQMTGLAGIAAKELFLWLPVKGIRVDVPSSGIIYFDVGVVLKQFPVSVFEIAPDCDVDRSSLALDEVYGRNSVEVRQKIERNSVELRQKIERNSVEFRPNIERNSVELPQKIEKNPLELRPAIERNSVELRQKIDGAGLRRTAAR